MGNDSTVVMSKSFGRSSVVCRFGAIIIGVLFFVYYFVFEMLYNIRLET